MRKLALHFLTASALVRFSASAEVDFKKEIAPILQKSCVECHGPNKQKADLRLDTKEAAMKGSKTGPVIIAGDAEKSEVIRRITLPKGHDDIMPSKGDPLTKEQTDLFKNWIKEGAKWPDDFAIKAGEESQTAEGGAPVKLPDFKPSGAEVKAVVQLEAAGVSVRPIAQNVNWKEATFRGLGTNATDATIAPVKDILGLLDLNLAGTKVTDSGLGAIKGLTNLTTLHLEHTKISDAGLDNLKNLKNLVYLNLFDTPVTDAGLQKLEGLTNLKNLYVWQSKVTDDGIKKLQAKLSKTKIHNGWDLNAMAKKEEKKEEKPAEKK